jgi:hypothetical protein
MHRPILLLTGLVAAFAGSAPLESASASTVAGAQLVKYFSTASITIPESFGADAGGMALDAAGNLYVGLNASGGHADIAAFDSTGKFVRSWAADNSLSGRDLPLVLTVGPDGLIYAAPDTGGGSIAVFKTDGTPVRTFADKVGLTHVTGIAVGAHGDLWLTSQGNSELGTDDDSVVHLSPAGAVLGRFAPLPGKHFGYNIINGLALDPDGTLWVTAGGTLLHFDASGHRLAAPDLTALLGTEQPSHVAVAGGLLYLTGGTDEIRSSRAVVVITPTGQLVDEIAGTAGLILAGEDNIYLTDYVSPTTATHATRATGSLITEFHGQNVESPPPGGAWGSGTCAGSSTGTYQGVSFVSLPNTPECKGKNGGAVFINTSSPCGSGEKREPGRVFVGGQEIDTQIQVDSNPRSLVAYAVIPGDEARNGSVVFEYLCTNTAAGTSRTVYEWKGELTLLDPSGQVVDASGAPILGASVSIRFAPAQNGRFVPPAPAGIDPQLTREKTGASGSFGWDVADGFWRLQVTAFGYRPFTSPVYHVPPAITGLIIKLTPDPRQQARLIDPAGKVGDVKLGSPATSGLRSAGLALRVVGGRIARITVQARRFRTAPGISVGSTLSALEAAYPSASVAKLRLSPTSLRVGRAAFTIKSGRVSAITLAR